MLAKASRARWRGLATWLVLVLFVPSTARSSQPQLPLALAREGHLAHSSGIGRHVMRGMFGFPHAARLRGGGRDGGSQGGNEIVMAEESSEEEESSEITRILGKDDGGARGRRRWDDDEGMVVEQGPFAAKRGFGEEEGPMLGKRGFDDEDDPQALPNEDETTYTLTPEP
ncbi:hypothetical protein T484DRAFT_1740777 [Baffinella frigidus]|nr:hypothetical protein T484DRAFT_1740777 [Cryptophyta sp. CCMP2293]